jgi:hypothetical protein
MGTYLDKGSVANGKLRCPLHGWEYAGDGRCTSVPASPVIPPFACQTVFPTTELGGHVLFYNAPIARFPMPFFDGVSVDDLLPAEPFELSGDVPWYMIGANAFDAQHFNMAHDRKIVGQPVVDSPSPFARRISATYEVGGETVRDRLTRKFSGPLVRMSITVWGGPLVLVTAAFARTTSYGMVLVRPIAPNRTRFKVIVWVPRRKNAAARSAIDPLDASIRRRFIRAFLEQDTAKAGGACYNPATLIDADQELRGYFDWLATVAPAEK